MVGTWGPVRKAAPKFRTFVRRRGDWLRRVHYSLISPRNFLWKPLGLSFVGGTPNPCGAHAPRRRRSALSHPPGAFSRTKGPFRTAPLDTLRSDRPARRLPLHPIGSHRLDEGGAVPLPRPSRATGLPIAASNLVANLTALFGCRPGFTKSDPALPNAPAHARCRAAAFGMHW